MGRKVRRAQPPAKPQHDRESPPLALGGQPSSPAPVTGGQTQGVRQPPRPAPAIKRPPGKPGRPSNVEVAAREAERRQLEQLTPEMARPMVGTVLHALCLAAKGDPPLDRDVDLVTPPATMVANKYAVSSKWAPEIALIGSVALVVQGSRSRRADRIRKAEKMPDRADTARATPPAPEPPPPVAPSLEAVVAAGAGGAP